MLGRRLVFSVAGWMVVLLVSLTSTVNAQQRKPKPQPPPGGVTPACVTGCVPDYAVEVTPDNANGGSKPMNTGGYTAVFTVRNRGTLPDTYTITCLSTGPVICTGLSAASLALDIGEAAIDTVFYNVGNAGSGQARLMAESDHGDAVNDQGSYNVTVVAPPGPAVVVFRKQNGDNLDRSLCLTTGGGEASAWMCGDLVVTHALPGYSTIGRERQLTLLYNSAQAVPKPLVAVAVTNGGNTLTPDSVHVELQVNGVPRATAQYSPWGGIPGDDPTDRVDI